MTRKREKEASRALSSMPGETMRTVIEETGRSEITFKSLSKQAYDFRNWIENQPEWIQRRHDLIQDRFTESDAQLSGIDLDLAVMDRLSSDLRLIRAGRANDLKPLYLPGSKNPRTFNSHIGGHSGNWVKHSHAHSHYDPSQMFASVPGHQHSHDKPKKRKRRQAKTIAEMTGRTMRIPYNAPRAGYRIVSPGTYRIFDNKRFIIDDQYRNKEQARRMAGFWRSENFNARVIPTRKGYAVYIRKR